MSHPVGYREYMASPQWRARKTLYFATRERRCLGCEATEDIHLHHHTYVRLGAERDADLVPVCGACHRLIHRHHAASGLDLTTATFAVLALARQHGRDNLPKRLRRLPVPQLDRGHVPVRQRDAERSPDGRLAARGSWRDESRPWWTQAAKGVGAERRRNGL